MIRHFEEELKKLKEKLLYMASLAETMIDYAIKSLMERKEDLTKEVYKHEEEVNKIHIEIDDTCLKLIALYQPTANDLRFITSIMKINSELERIGDHAINIAQTIEFLLKYPSIKIEDIPKMADIVTKMIRDSLNAFVNGDIELAKSVLIKDNEVDELKRKIFEELLSQMLSAKKKTHPAVDLLLISRNLERLGDHATNIAEDVIFIISGEDVRHHTHDKTF
jgi:phosphate transport system protein